MASAVGVVLLPGGVDRPEIADLVAEADGILRALGEPEPGRETLHGLAGPNDVIQLILDPWLTAAVVVGVSGVGLVAGSALKKIGENLGEAIWKRVAAWVKGTKERGFHPGFVIRLDLRQENRNVGLIPADNPEDIARQINALTTFGSGIKDAVTALAGSGAVFAKNIETDCSVKLELVPGPDGDLLKLKWRTPVPGALVYADHERVFGPLPKK
jgi:hypothetical protein